MKKGANFPETPCMITIKYMLVLKITQSDHTSSLLSSGTALVLFVCNVVDLTTGLLLFCRKIYKPSLAGENNLN